MLQVFSISASFRSSGKSSESLAIEPSSCAVVSERP